jgi:hypothetical protein
MSTGKQWRCRRRTNRSLRLCGLSKLNNTATLGASAVKENLSKLDLTGGLEEFNQILIGSRPWQLKKFDQTHVFRSKEEKKTIHSGP